MPHQGTPVLRDGRLWREVGHPLGPEGARPLVVGTVAWFDWLKEADCFCYMAPHSSYRLTIRKEKRRHG